MSFWIYVYTHVQIFCERYFKIKVTIFFYQIDVYDVLRNDRSRKRGGGLAAYIKYGYINIVPFYSLVIRTVSVKRRGLVIFELNIYLYTVGLILSLTSYSTCFCMKLFNHTLILRLGEYLTSLMEWLCNHSLHMLFITEE